MKRLVMHLQADDEFVNMLAKIRSGQGAAFVKDLRERCSAPIDIDGIVATRVSGALNIFLPQYSCTDHFTSWHRSVYAANLNGANAR